MTNNIKEPRSIKLNIGSASIIMLFVLLCLTVLSVLSLLSANSQKRLADKAAEVATNYYAAEVKAVKIFNEIQAGNFEQPGVTTAIDGNTTHCTYEVPIDDIQTLSVEVNFIVDEINDWHTEIEQWKIVDSGEWNPSGSLDVLQVE
jgi:Tfp pilus assembly protein PilX